MLPDARHTCVLHGLLVAPVDRLLYVCVCSFLVSSLCFPSPPGGFSPRASPGLGAAAKREQWAGGGGASGGNNGVSGGSQDSTGGQFLAVPGQEGMAASPERRKMGGSYSRYTGGGKSPVAGGMVLVTDGELCDSSGRVIKTTVTPPGAVSPPPVAGLGRGAGTPVPQRN